MKDDTQYPFICPFDGTQIKRTKKRSFCCGNMEPHFFSFKGHHYLDLLGESQVFKEKHGRLDVSMANSSSIAEMYTHSSGLLRREQILRLLRKYSSPTTIMGDFGCGSGLYSFDLSDKVQTGFGLDYSKSNIKFADRIRQAKNLSNLMFVQCDITKQVFLPHTIGLALCTEVIEHLPESAITLLLQCISNSLVKGGVLILTTPTPFLDRKINDISVKLARQLHYSQFITHRERFLRDRGRFHNFFSREEILSYLEETGFEVIEYSTVVPGYPIGEITERLYSFMRTTTKNNRKKIYSSEIGQLGKIKMKLSRHKQLLFTILSQIDVIGKHHVVAATKP